MKTQCPLCRSETGLSPKKRILSIHEEAEGGLQCAASWCTMKVAKEMAEARLRRRHDALLEVIQAMPDDHEVRRDYEAMASIAMRAFDHMLRESKRRLAG